MSEVSTVPDREALAELAMNDQFRAQRIIEMARIIEEVSDDLPVDSEPRRLRACAQVIYEAADLMIDNLERIEVALRKGGRALGRNEAAK